MILFYAANKGWGVKAAQVIPRGTFVIEYVGEVITEAESESRRRVSVSNVSLFSNGRISSICIT